MQLSREQLLHAYADMSATSNGRVLRIALAASLAAHLIFAAIVHSHPVKAAPEQKAQPTRIIVIHVPPPTPRPTPPPPKPQAPHPQQRPRTVRPAVHPPRVPKVAPKVGPNIAPPVEPTGEPNVAQTVAPLAAPTPAPIAATPTPKPACSAPDVPARTQQIQQADVPDDPQVQGYAGTAKVKVDLNAHGMVVGASIYKSTGFMQLDRAAVEAARGSTYAPEERDCKNVSGSYLFTVDFQ